MSVEGAFFDVMPRVLVWWVIVEVPAYDVSVECNGYKGFTEDEGRLFEGEAHTGPDDSRVLNYQSEASGASFLVDGIVDCGDREIVIGCIEILRLQRQIQFVWRDKLVTNGD